MLLLSDYAIAGACWHMRSLWKQDQLTKHNQEHKSRPSAHGEGQDYAQTFQPYPQESHPTAPLTPSLCFQAFYYPEEAGLAFGGPGSSRYLRLEIHYHNPLVFKGEWAHGDAQCLPSEAVAGELSKCQGLPPRWRGLHVSYRRSLGQNHSPVCNFLDT